MRLEKPTLPALGYLLAALVATAPAWIVRHPPLEDLPFHLSSLRVLHDYANPAFGFTEDFALNVTRTAYLLYYFLGDLLAYVLGVHGANVALMSLYLGGTPLSLRVLLRELGKDERLCLFAIPFGVNVMFVYGLLPFMLGVPLMFLATAAAVRHFLAPTPRTAWTLGALAVALFFMHVFPFALFGVAFAAMFPWRRRGEWLRAGLPVVPSLLCALVWTIASPAGQAATRGGGAPVLGKVDRGVAGFLSWSTSIFKDDTNDVRVGLVFVIALASLILARNESDGSKPIGRPYVWVLALCIAGWVGLGTHLGDVWLLAQRFPVLALLCAIPLLRIPSGFRGRVITAAIAAASASSVVNVCDHFRAFEHDEVGAFDDALATMEPRKKVCGLIFDPLSKIVRAAPFLHFVSYYQAEKGGVTMFTYAGIPSWPGPFRFREGHDPPPGGPPRLRWEWTPKRTPIEEIFPYYDYVLVRGDGFHPPAGTYHVSFQGGDRWTVWAKDGA